MPAMIGQRKTSEWLAAVVQPQHYRALVNMARVYPSFADNLWRYLSGRGSYPCDIEVRTPVGPVRLRLYSYHDMLTVNEIFCRKDYPAGPGLRYVLDIGSNIGISALYFLTRNHESRCILYEPDPKNVERLRHNLRGYEHRYQLVESAVSDVSGPLSFGVEESGRYGGIGLPTGHSITVQCVHIDEALRAALQSFPRIDILKIDTEGVEVQTVNAIDSALLPHIQNAYIEAQPREPLRASHFHNRQYGSIRQLRRLAG
jgi:FkbM family methyltransferase